MRFKDFLAEQEKTYKPPQSVASAAEKGLKYRKRGGYGGLTNKQASQAGIGSGVQRAVNLKNRDNISLETIKRMKSFFARHKKNAKINPEYKDEPWKDNGYVAWLLWGGDAGEKWVNSILDGLNESFHDSVKIGGEVIEFFKNPSGSELMQLFKKSYDSGVRIGIKNKDIFVWIEDILHSEAQKALKIKFDLRLEYTKGRDILFLSSGETESNFKNQWNTTFAKKMKQIFPLVKKIEQSTKPFKNLYTYK